MPRIRACFTEKGERKSRESKKWKTLLIFVDNVENLSANQLFAYSVKVSGPHSYQQIPCLTIFK